MKTPLHLLYRCSKMIKDDSLRSFQLAFGCVDLRQRGKSVKVLRNVRIVNSAIVLCHFKGRVSQQSLKHERIPATVHKIFAGEGVPEQVNAGFLHATGAVIMGNGKPQAVF